MAKRPNHERLAELEEKARKLRMETAIEKSPALQEIQKALRCLGKAQIAHKQEPALSEAESEAIESMCEELVALLEVRGEAPKAAVAS